MCRIGLTLVVALVAVACGPTAEERAAEAAAQAAAEADSLMAEAEAAFDAAVFDTLTWENDEARLARGETVYNISCEKCHGIRGLGDAGAVMRGDTLRPPSFLEPTWALAGNLEGIRYAVFLGNKEGMPHWGVVDGMHAEGIDAAAYYIIVGLPNK